jgi:hypothetical protein
MRCRVTVGADIGCPDEAVAMVVTELGDSTLEAVPVCGDHAPEFAHEVASSMNEDEFAILTLRPGQVGGLT